jgi:hypothetical protein
LNKACLNGLSSVYRNQINAQGIINFDELRPEDVIRQVPAEQLDLDWSAVIYIKNFQGSQAGGTVIWSNDEGFFRTNCSSKAVMDRLTATQVLTWFDMNTMVEFLQLSSPVPFVLGPIVLVSTDRPSGSGYTSWLGCQFETHINGTMQERQVRVLLSNGLALIVHDTAARLRKKVAEAREILMLQQQIQQEIAQQHVTVPPAGKIRPVMEVARQFQWKRDCRLIGEIFGKTGLDPDPKLLEKALHSLYQGEGRSYDFINERS